MDFGSPLASHFFRALDTRPWSDALERSTGVKAISEDFRRNLFETQRHKGHGALVELPIRCPPSGVIVFQILESFPEAFEEFSKRSFVIHSLATRNLKNPPRASDLKPFWQAGCYARTRKPQTISKLMETAATMTLRTDSFGSTLTKGVTLSDFGT
jgi:hypothetical protein